MKETRSGITSLFGNSPRMKIMEFFMQFPKNEFTVPELVEGIGMSRTTAFNEVNSLLKDEMIIEIGKSGKSKIFKVNLKSPIVLAMQKINSYRSKKVAASQITRKNIMKSLPYTMNVEILQLQKTMLEEELKVTNTRLEEIPAR